MRRLSLVLLAALRLCRARSPGFSIHDDLLAFPQFDVVFSDGYVSVKDAEALLENRSRSPTYSADFSQPTTGNTREANAAEADGATDAYSYEIMNMSPHRYLCSIPVIEPSLPENQTANELARKEEARELSRAASKGWELLTKLEDSCLYFMSGWWSYSFCNNREIVQFHALTATANGQPPRRDPHTAEFILGRVPSIPATAERQKRRHSDDAPPLPAELQVKGDQRYLVQRLEGGTVCDLTGRERTVEVQYHCVPGMKSDRIGWIKEVTICAYVMIVNTPRLCNDIAFLPPQETKANPISCQLIADDDTPDAIKQAETSETKDAEKETEVTVGGVVIGARKLAPPRGFWTGQEANEDRLIEVLVRAASKEDGGKIQMPTAEELEQLDIDPKIVEEMKAKMVEMAGDAGWKLEVVELNGGDFRELRGIIDGDEAGDESGSVPGADASRGKKEDKQKKDKTNKGKPIEDKKNKDKAEGGSEEQFFKEEL
ncbi:glucosidase II beta subunit-like protein [Hirsutella rhossiliensis]|uniref:Endoplasmic reticulum lectin n=1 Tax=Hirsutella rhossiliensis TaxID=111463 RepID=A0A9P8NBM6_9HYPO|nr:glucosidase II beta subunit-like protein [Hirsutella rhossiliensis]KAH0968187.1 glucosidase II beta subunit-like protein [Hirsutella rhossiliensis]